MMGIFTAEQMELINKPTPVELHEKYDYPNFKATGVNFDKARQFYNEIFGVGNWYTEIDMNFAQVEITKDFSCASLPVTCFITIGGLIVWKNTTIGSGVNKFKADRGNILKAAQADGIKKNFSYLGIFGDIYGGAFNVEEKTKAEIHISEKDREQLKSLALDIQTMCRVFLSKVKLIDEPNKIQAKYIKYNGMKNFYKDITDILHQAKIDKEPVLIEMDEKITSFEDFKSVKDLEIVKNRLPDYLKGILDG